jgi:dihydrolipoamide dehydrogenase
MQEFDVIVVGSGSGLIVASEAAERGLRVAQIEDDALGGTCLNWGCIPSKAVIYPADVIRLIGSAGDFGVKAQIKSLDFGSVMARMRSIVLDGRNHIERAFEQTDNPKLYRGKARFVGDKALRVNEVELRAGTIILANGASPAVPPVKGLREAAYLDNHSVFGLEEPPRGIVIIGGGFIAAEMAHFLSAFGSEVTVLGRNPRFLPREEPEVSEVVSRALGQRCRILTGTSVTEVVKRGRKKLVRALRGSEEVQIEAEEILLAAGMRPNTNGMGLELTGVKVDSKGGIVVNQFLETTREGVWALGDVLGRHMFKHVANYEASLVAHNAFASPEERVAVDYHAVPHAIFTEPTVGSVGMTEAEVHAQGIGHLIGWAEFMGIAKGEIMRAEGGFVKAIVEKSSGRILGCHIVGPGAPELIQEVITAMNSGKGDYHPILRAMHIHPALSEVVVNAFGGLRDPHEARPHRHPPTGIEARAASA